MPRPCKCRRIAREYGIGFFGPKGIPMRELERVVLTHDELEALRLVDMEGMYQEDAASMMEISRPTLSRLLEVARKKIVSAVIDGKGIEVGGGNFLVETTASGSQGRCRRRDKSTPKRCKRSTTNASNAASRILNNNKENL